MHLNLLTLVRTLTAPVAAAGALVTIVLAAADFLQTPRPDGRLTVVALLLYAVGAGLFIWARVTLRLHAPALSCSSTRRPKVVVHGPYRFVRHPVLTAYLAIWLAGSVATFSPWMLLATLWVVTACVASALGEEAAFERSMFAEAYRAYKRQTGMLVPRIHLELGYEARQITW